tara:strand:- start:28035 stop:28697 length:663 start_codon:yes stop_codon:yes gene_type:complete
VLQNAWLKVGWNMLKTWACWIRFFISFAAIAAVHPATASSSPAPFLPGGLLADAPSGFVAMCARDQTLCRPDHATGTVSSSKNRNNGLEQLRNINRHVNRDIVQRSDWQSYGTGEHWAKPAPRARATGDCEDIAMEKRARLVASGFDPKSLFLAVTYRPRNGLHVVLVARLEDGDYILDNLYPQVVHWYRTDYVWLRQQSTDNPKSWLTVENMTTDTSVS